MKENCGECEVELRRLSHESKKKGEKGDILTRRHISQSSMDKLVGWRLGYRDTGIIWEQRLGRRAASIQHPALKAPGLWIWNMKPPFYWSSRPMTLVFGFSLKPVCLRMSCTSSLSSLRKKEPAQFSVDVEQEMAACILFFLNITYMLTLTQGCCGVYTLFIHCVLFYLFIFSQNKKGFLHRHPLPLFRCLPTSVTLLHIQLWQLVFIKPA